MKYRHLSQQEAVGRGANGDELVQNWLLYAVLGVLETGSFAACLLQLLLRDRGIPEDYDCKFIF